MTSKEAVSRIKVLLGLDTEYNFNSYKVAEGGEFKVEGELEIGKPIYVITEDGEIPAPDGNFKLEDDTEVKVVDGLVKEVKASEEEVEEEVIEVEAAEEDKKEEVEEAEFIEVALIDGTIVGNDEAELAEGQQLFIVTEEGRTVAPDGEHETEDGKIVVVEEGVIIEIKEKEVVEGEELTEVVEEEMNIDEVVETFTKAIEVLKEEIENLKNTNKTLSTEFNAFRALPAGEKVLNNKTVRENMGVAKMTKLQALSNLRNK
jgi:hypothetical protein